MFSFFSSDPWWPSGGHICSKNSPILCVRSQISNVYIWISFKLGTIMEPILGLMHMFWFLSSDPRWLPGSHICTKNSLILCVWSRISEDYIWISFKLGTTMKPILGHMHMFWILSPDPRWLPGGHICSKNSPILCVRSQISIVYIRISFKLGTMMEPMSGLMHMSLFLSSDPRWLPGGHIGSKNSQILCVQSRILEVGSCALETWLYGI